MPATNKPAGHEEMRRHNLLLVLGRIGGGWPIDKADLAKLTGLSWGSVTSITRDLKRLGLIQSTKTAFEGRGRNPALFRLRKNSRFAAGIDLGVTTVRATIMDLEGTTIDAVREDSPVAKSKTPQQAIAHCSAFLEKLLNKHRIPRAKLLGVGVGIAGVVDADRGVCLALDGRSRWPADVPVAELFRSSLQLPIMLERSGNCIAYAELNYGAAMRLSDAICLSLGDSLSAGFIFDSTVYRGAHNNVGDIGRVAVMAGTGAGAGGAGAELLRLSDLVSNRAVVAQWRKLSGQTHVTAKHVHDLAMAGNAKAEALFQEIGRALGVVIGNLMNLLSPERIILGGRLTNSRPLFEKAMQESLNRTVMPGAKFDVQTSPLGEMDVAKGAAALLMATAFATGEGLLTPARPVART